MHRLTTLRRLCKKLIDETMLFLEDLKRYDIPSSGTLQIFITKKIQRLQGLYLKISQRESESYASEDIDITTLNQTFSEIKSEIHYSAKKWKREVSQEMNRLKRDQQLYFASTL